MLEKKGVSFWLVAVGLITWVVVILAISFFYFFASVVGHMEKQASASLHDTSKSVVQLLETKIQGQWATLAPVAEVAKREEDMLHSEELISLMDTMKTSSYFSMVFVADAKGNSVDHKGVRSNVSDREYFKNTMRGYRNISQALTSKTTDEDVFVFARPVYGNLRIRGVIAAAIRVEDFQEMIDSSPFDGMGYTYIVSRKGDILVESTVDQHPIDEQNVLRFFSRADTESSIDTEKLKADMMERQKGHFTFVSNQNVQIVYYMPMRINDWYVFCAVPLDYMKSKSSELLSIILQLCLGVLAALVPIVIAVLMEVKFRREILLNRNKELQWNEERFRMISALSKGIIFEVDWVKGTVLYPDISAEFHRRMGYEPVTENFPGSLIENGHLHPDDCEAFLAMHTNILPFTKKLSGEFRLKVKGEGYSWYRIEEVLLPDKNGTIIKSVGRVLDINDEKKAMELLEAKTKIDSGSGLYNKHATELLVAQCLEDDKENSHAIVILDIDDFKALNDSKGHYHGDQVIIGLANVLRNQFRSTDILGRIGGDEFMICIKDIPNELFAAIKVAKIQKAITELHEISVSAGVAIYPTDGRTFPELYKCADMAMYFAKKNNGFGFFVDIAKERLMN